MNNVIASVFLVLFAWFMLGVAQQAFILFSFPFNFIVPGFILALLAFLFYKNVKAFKEIPSDLIAFKSYLSQMTMGRGITISLFFLFGVILPILGMMNCSGWNEGSGTVSKCLISGGFMIGYANFYYGLMLLSAFMFLIPLVVYVAILLFLYSRISKASARYLSTFSIWSALLQFFLIVTGPFDLALSIVTSIAAIDGLFKNRVEGYDRKTAIKCWISLIVSIFMAMCSMTVIASLVMRA